MQWWITGQNSSIAGRRGIMDQCSRYIPRQYPPGETNGPNSRLNSQKNPSPQSTNNSGCLGFQDVGPTVRHLAIYLHGWLDRYDSEDENGSWLADWAISCQVRYRTTYTPCLNEECQQLLTQYQESGSTDIADHLISALDNARRARWQEVT
jgi:hypothetical protein